MWRKYLQAAAIALLCAAGVGRPDPVIAATFQGLGKFPGVISIRAEDISADGRVVVANVRCHGGRATFMTPRRETVEVVDADGKPVAGARVAMRAASWVGYGEDLFCSVRELDCAVEGPPTDAAGRSVLTVADAPGVFLAWTADRHCRVAREATQRIEDGVLRIGAEGEPRAGATVRLAARC